MKTDIYQRLEADFGEKIQDAKMVIDDLGAVTKGLVANAQIRAIIFEANGNIELLRRFAENFEYNRIIEENAEIDFEQPFKKRVV